MTQKMQIINSMERAEFLSVKNGKITLFLESGRARADMTRRQKEQNVRSTELMLIKDIVLKIADG